MKFTRFIGCLFVESYKIVQTATNFIWTENVPLHLRYIDHIFILWKNTKAELIIFIKELNEKHKTFKFDFQISPTEIAFPDIMRYKNENKNNQTTLYRKPTDEKAFWHAKSEHLRYLKNSILHSQALTFTMLDFLKIVFSGGVNFTTPPYLKKN